MTQHRSSFSPKPSGTPSPSQEQEEALLQHKTMPIFEQIAIGMALVSIEGQWLRTNQKLRDMLGYGDADLPFFPFQEIAATQDTATAPDFTHRLLTGEIETYTLEKRYQHKDGSFLWTRLTISLSQDEKDIRPYFIVVIEDITERKRLEEALSQQQTTAHRMAEKAEAERQRYLSLLMQAPALVCLLEGPHHILTFANAQYRQLLPTPDVLHKPLHEAIPTLHRNFFETLEQAYTSNEPTIGKEVPIQLGDKKGYVDFVYQPLKEEQESLTSILFYGVDVTEKVLTRETIKKNEQRMQLAQRAGHIGTFEWNIPSNTILWTPELEALYGLPAGGFEGGYKNWAQRVHPDDLAQAEENLQCAAAGGPSYNVEFRITQPDGTIRWMHGMGDVTTYDSNGQPQDMVGINIDITERKQAEHKLVLITQQLQHFADTLEEQVTERTQVLIQTNKELQRSNQELQEFAYVASHDLQEPLRKIQSFGNLLEEEKGKELGSGKLYLDRMRQAAARMQILINDLLTFSRVTTKALPFSPVDLRQIAHEVVDDLAAQLETTQGLVKIESLPTIQADPLQMRQMLQNLIGNALKFHRPAVPPVVTVAASIISAPAEQTESDTPGPDAYCQIVVKDNGIGFDEKYLDRMFIVFQRLHGKGAYEGTGIGLAIVRKIVERHEGTIKATSTLGEGSTFIVTLPLSQPSLKESSNDE